MLFNKEQVMTDEEVIIRYMNECKAQPCERIYTCFICKKRIEAGNGLGSLTMYKNGETYVPIHDIHIKGLDR